MKRRRFHCLKIDQSRAEKKRAKLIHSKHYNENIPCTNLLSYLKDRAAAHIFPSTIKISHFLSPNYQYWLLRLRPVRRPPREKIEATEWAKPTAIATFTWPLFGIGRPENLCEKLPPLIMSPLPPAIAFAFASQKIQSLLANVKATDLYLDAAGQQLCLLI